VEQRRDLGLLGAGAASRGFINVPNWYPIPWYFPPVHRFLAYVLVGSVLVHIGVKLPDIAYGLKAKVADADVVTEIPWNENPYSHSNAGTLPAPPAWHLAAGCWAAAGAGIGVVVVTAVSQTLPQLEPIGLLAPRQWTKGPQGVPVNRTADQTKIIPAARSPSGDCKYGGRGRTSLRWLILNRGPCTKRDLR
jgi:hypothetical protein